MQGQNQSQKPLSGKKAPQTSLKNFLNAQQQKTTNAIKLNSAATGMNTSLKKPASPTSIAITPLTRDLDNHFGLLQIDKMILQLGLSLQTQKFKNGGYYMRKLIDTMLGKMCQFSAVYKNHLHQHLCSLQELSRVMIPEREQVQEKKIYLPPLTPLESSNSP